MAFFGIWRAKQNENWRIRPEESKLVARNYRRNADVLVWRLVFNFLFRIIIIKYCLLNSYLMLPVYRTYYSPTPQVVHSNSSCPTHSEQVGWQRTHWLFSRNCPLWQADDGLHPTNATQHKQSRNTTRELMAVLVERRVKRPVRTVSKDAVSAQQVLRLIDTRLCETSPQITCSTSSLSGNTGQWVWSVVNIW